MNFYWTKFSFNYADSLLRFLWFHVLVVSRELQQISRWLATLLLLLALWLLVFTMGGLILCCEKTFMLLRFRCIHRRDIGLVRCIFGVHLLDVSQIQSSCFIALRLCCIWFLIRDSSIFAFQHPTFDALRKAGEKMSLEYFFDHFGYVSVICMASIYGGKFHLTIVSVGRLAVEKGFVYRYNTVALGLLVWHLFLGSIGGKACIYKQNWSPIHRVPGLHFFAVV